MTDRTATAETWKMLGDALYDLMKANERIESDLAEIKARLAHASPGYDLDMQPEAAFDGADGFEAFERQMAGNQEEGR